MICCVFSLYWITNYSQQYSSSSSFHRCIDFWGYFIFTIGNIVELVYGCVCVLIYNFQYQYLCRCVSSARAFHSLPIVIWCALCYMTYYYIYWLRIWNLNVRKTKCAMCIQIWMFPFQTYSSHLFICCCPVCFYFSAEHNLVYCTATRWWEMLMLNRTNSVGTQIWNPIVSTIPSASACSIRFYWLWYWSPRMKRRTHKLRIKLARDGRTARTCWCSTR